MANELAIASAQIRVGSPENISGMSRALIEKSLLVNLQIAPSVSLQSLCRPGCNHAAD